MADKVYGLSDNDVRVLKDMVASWRRGQFDRKVQPERRPARERTDCIFGIPDDELDAYNSGQDPPYATLKIYNYTSTGGTTVTEQTATIYNVTPTARTTDQFVVCVRDFESGRWQVAGGGGGTYKKHLCRFELEEELTVASSEANAHVLEYIGEGNSHPSDYIVVRNMQRQDEDYEFYGDEGDIGYAYFHEDSGGGDYDGTWVIIVLECP